MKTEEATKPSIYCGTYAKYNNGSINGAWMNLEDYTDVEEFYNACRELHKDEEDPEYMFQDYEGFPASLYSESMDASSIEKLLEFAQLDEDDREIVSDYWEDVDASASIEQAQNCYAGNIEDIKGDGWMNNDTAYGWYVIDNGLLGLEIPDALVNYIDVEAIGRDYSMDVTITENGNIFNSY